MDELTRLAKDHHAKKFAEHGATALGVDWRDESEMRFRYGKMLAVLDEDFHEPAHPSLLDVGCGWGGMLAWATEQGIALDYTGIDLVDTMAAHGRAHHPEAKFLVGDALELATPAAYDYVVCNGALTQRLTVSIAEMERYAKKLVRKMYELCRRGIAFNLMSNQVNFTVDNLFYKSPVETFAWCLGELSPRVRLDHGYSSLANGRGKFYDYTIYVYKD